MDEPADDEVAMEAVPARMPLRYPQVREARPNGRPELSEERRDISPELARVMAALARIRERRKPVEPVLGGVSAHMTPSPPYGLSRRAILIALVPLAAIPGTSRSLEAATGLACVRIQVEEPPRLDDIGHPSPVEV